MKFFIYSGVPENLNLSQWRFFFEQFVSRGALLGIPQKLDQYFSEQNLKDYDWASFQSPDELSSWRPDFGISLGGDGTALQSVSWIVRSQAPILGINIGRLGFLTGAEINELPQMLDAIFTGKYIVEHRSMIQLQSQKNYFSDFPHALNDFTILKRDTSSMIAVQVKLDGQYLNTYWADGFIIATPTGSTGYSLSCGGPIIFPNAGCFALTPVAPHQLNVRPIIVHENTKINIHVEARTPSVLMTMDSRHTEFYMDEEITVLKSPYNIPLIHIPQRGFMYNMKEKLRWGADVRTKF